MTKIFYEKKGRRYIPVAFYDSTYMDSFPVGVHLVEVYKGGTSRRFNIDAAYAPMIAAGRYARDVISDALVKASDLRPSKTPITPEQAKAWHKLSKIMGDDIHRLAWPSAQEAAEAAVKAMADEALKLLENPAVKKAYDHFMLVAKLAKDQNDQT